MKLQINTDGQTVTLPRRDVEMMEKYIEHLNNLFSVINLEGKLVSAVTQQTFGGGMTGSLNVQLEINLNANELKNICIDEPTKDNLFNEISKEYQHSPLIEEYHITRALKTAEIERIILWENGKPTIFWKEKK